MKKIDFEAHFYTQDYMKAMYGNKGYPRFSDDPSKCGVGVQLLSLSAPGIEQFDPETGTALAPKNPKAAVDELERAVTELGFCGGGIPIRITAIPCWMTPLTAPFFKGPTDYPYEDMEECIGFIDGLPLSGEDKDHIYGLNAAGLGFRA